MAQEGANVLVTDNQLEATNETATIINAECGMNSCISVHGDIREETFVKQTIDLAVATFGRLDCIVHNAANQKRGSLEEMTDDDWNAVHDVNVRALVHYARHSLPHLKQQQGSSIVALASMVGVMALPGRIAYNSSKTAVMGLVRALAVELGEFGIRVNAIAPGHIMTQGEAQWQKDNTERDKSIFPASYPLGRVGTSEEVAGVAAFLASADAGFITGETIMTDGGMSIMCPETAVFRAAEIIEKRLGHEHSYG